MMRTQLQTILIVDDEPLNLKMLEAHLQSAGYRVWKASSGLEAMKMARDNPDLILLDIMMPDMDGFATCRGLKADEKTRDIPVIFLSALHDIKSKVLALDVGGVDYVSKPFETRELLARVRCHLTLQEQDRQIKNYANYLEEMVKERTRQLIHADRLATLGTFSSAIVHEINNPNTYIGGNADLIRMFWEHARPIVERHCNEDSTGRVTGTFKKVDHMIASIMEGSRRITQMVNNLKNYGRQGSSQKVECRLIDPLNDAIDLVGYRLKRGIRVEANVTEDIVLCCDPQKICQVFVNLLNNAIDAINAMEGIHGTIDIQASSEFETIIIRVKDSGLGISNEVASNSFDPFYTTKPKERGTGLGLFIVRSIIEEHQGHITIEPFSGDGAEFKIVLPVSQGPCGDLQESGQEAIYPTSKGKESA